MSNFVRPPMSNSKFIVLFCTFIIFSYHYAVYIGAALPTEKIDKIDIHSEKHILKSFVKGAL